MRFSSLRGSPTIACPLESRGKSRAPVSVLPVNSLPSSRCIESALYNFAEVAGPEP